jgi:hypothetical protein
MYTEAVHVAAIHQRNNVVTHSRMLKSDIDVLTTMLSIMLSD